MSIYYFHVGRYSTSSQIYTYRANKISKDVISDGATIGSKIKALKSKPNQRDKLKSSYGVWSVTRDENDLVYAVCSSNDYP
jgi:hypothetical protein